MQCHLCIGSPPDSIVIPNPAAAGEESAPVHPRPVPPQAESRFLPSVGMTNLVGTAEASEFTVRVAVESAVALILWLESLPLPCCRLLLFTAVVASAALPLYAQDYPRGDAFGGYQRTSFPDGTLTTVSGDGWNTGGAFYFSQWLGVKGEFSGTYARASDHGAFLSPSQPVRRSALR